MRKSLLKLLFLSTILAGAMGPRPAYAEPLSVDLSGNTFILPLQVVNATQLYSFEEGKGYPALETVLVERGKSQLTFGAAPILGSSINVPFVSVQVRLSESFFDTSDNALRFGVWAGKPSVGKEWIWGIKASTQLW